MASRRRRRERMREAQRDLSSVSSRLSPTLLAPSYELVYDPLLEVEDLRRWSPVYEFPRDVGGIDARVSVKRGRGSGHVGPDVFRFQSGERVVRCVRRRIRREVLHALKRTRSGRGKPRKRDGWSGVSCR